MKLFAGAHFAHHAGRVVRGFGQDLSAAVRSLSSAADTIWAGHCACCDAASGAGSGIFGHASESVDGT